MCMNCVSNAEFFVASGGFTAYAFAKPTRSALVSLGVLPELDPLARDVNTVSFLRRLDLDPVGILGEEVVTAVDAWRPSAPVYRESVVRRVFDLLPSRRAVAYG